MDKNQEMLLHEIMANSFSALDLHLYLDTHPYDQKALMLHNSLSQKTRTLTENYERTYGPLSFGSPARYPGQWIESPWPWEND